MSANPGYCEANLWKLAGWRNWSTNPNSYPSHLISKDWNHILRRRYSLNYLHLLPKRGLRFTFILWRLVLFQGRATSTFFNPHHRLHLAFFIQLVQMSYDHNQRQIEYFGEFNAAGVQSFVGCRNNPQGIFGKKEHRLETTCFSLCPPTSMKDNILLEFSSQDSIDIIVLLLNNLPLESKAMMWWLFVWVIPDIN